MITVPMGHRLRDWINPKYVDLHETGRLREEWVTEAPFEHAVLPDFFQVPVLEAVQEACRRIPLERNGSYGLAKSSTLGWGPFYEPEILRFIYSPEFRRFLNQAMACELFMKARSVPQFNRYSAGSKGLPIHNDHLDDRDLVMLLQLTREYPSGGGGELVLHREGMGFESFRTILPVSNTLTLFRVGRESWHSVADMKGDWERTLLAFDWFVRA